eukprot:SAG31_NODE_24568_length_478_cov_2.042216_1_plen_48_part_10
MVGAVGLGNTAAICVLGWSEGTSVAADTTTTSSWPSFTALCQAYHSQA